MPHRVIWFDIPVSDLDRAIGFYSHVLSAKVEKQFPGQPVAVIEHGESDVSGCLHQSEDRPSDHGPLLYFNVQGRLDDAVAQAERYGGRVLKPKHQIGPYGWRAVILDSEGNRIALHSE